MVVDARWWLRWWLCEGGGWGGLSVWWCRVVISLCWLSVCGCEGVVGEVVM